MLVGSLKYIISCPLIVAHRINIILTRLKLAVLTGYSSYAVKGGAFVKSSQELLPDIHEAEHKQKTRGPAHRVSGLCECMRCSSSLKAAWAECTCAGAARYIVRAWALLDICKRTVF